MTRRIVLVDIGSGMVLSGVLPSVALFNAYSAKLSARGGVVPYVYSITAGALPDGLFIDSGTGIISGVTTTPGLFSFAARVTDLSGAFLDRQFSITVIAEPLMLSGHADNGIVDTAYSYTYTVSGGIPPYAWSIVAGALPSGVTLDAGTGELSGTPTAGGARSWTVRVTDSVSATADLPDSATFGYATLTLTGTYAAGTVGTAYSSDLTIAGGNGAYSNPHVTSGSLPAGLALSIVGNKLRLSGTPTAAATSAFTAAVDSGDGQTATSAQSVAVTAVPQTVWSAANKAADIILSNGNIDAESNSSAGGTVLSTSSKTSGKFYAEFEIEEIYSVTPGSGFGIHTGTASLAKYLGEDANGIGAWFQNDNLARVFQNGVTFNGTAGLPGVVGYRGRLAFDAGTGKIWLAYFVSTATVWLGAGSPDPATGTSPLTTLATGSPFYLACSPRRGDASNASNRNKIRLVDPANWRWAAPAGFGVWT